MLSCTTVLGAHCLFPFTYKGVTHTACTRADSAAAWCATGANPALEWGVCSQACPSEEECSTVRSGVQKAFDFLNLDNCRRKDRVNGEINWGYIIHVCFSGAKPGLKCKFPFRYQGTLVYLFLYFKSCKNSQYT